MWLSFLTLEIQNSFIHSVGFLFCLFSFCYFVFLWLLLFCLFNLFFSTKGLKVFVLQTCTMVTWNLTHRVDPSREGMKSLFSTGKVVVDKLSSPMTHAISV